MVDDEFHRPGKGHRADTRAADGDAHGERTAFLEVEADGDDGGQVDQSEAETTDHADAEIVEPDVRPKVAEEKAQGGQHGADESDTSAAVLVREDRGDRARAQRHGGQDAEDRRDPTSAQLQTILHRM